MASILQLASRPQLGPLGYSSQLPMHLLKRSSQRFARPGRTFHPLQKELLNPALRRPPWSSRRSYNKNIHAYNTPQSFWARKKPQIVVAGVIGLCCCTYYVQWTARKLSDKGDHALSDLIRRNLINSEENIRQGRWWVMISSSFAHGNLAHLGVNMLALWGFGTQFVELFGVTRFVGLWMFSAASCSAAYIYWQRTQDRLRREAAGRRWDKPENLTILSIPISRERAQAISGGSAAYWQFGGSEGASGVICGLAGTFLCCAPKMPVVFIILPMSLWLLEASFAIGTVFCMANGYLPLLGHAGHLGGTAAGIAYYYGAARLWLRRTGRF